MTELQKKTVFFYYGWIQTIGKYKLDGVGPVDNRPSTDKLHHLVLKKNKIKNKIKIVTRDMWHMTRDTWHETRLGGMNILSKF